MSGTTRGAVVALVGLLLLVPLIPTAAAHNPALTVYAPVALDDGLLVIGEEGTAALLSPDGQERWSTQLDLQLILRPATGHGLAAGFARNLTTLENEVVAFDADGLAWTQGLGTESTHGWVLATEDGFAALGADGTLTLLTADGERQTSQALPAPPSARPVVHPDGGWVYPTPDRRVLHVDAQGQLQAEAAIDGRSSGLTVTGDRILVGYGSVSTGNASVTALDTGLAPTWQATAPGFRVGGPPATFQDGIAFGTYLSEGAHVVRADGDGKILWDKQLANQTAAAVATDGERIFATVNQGVVAFDEDGTELWSSDLSPRLTPAAIQHGLILPSGADNRLVALDPATGETAWTWDDGVREVPWTDESLAQEGPPGQGGDEDDRSVIPTGPMLALVALAAVALARARR